MAFVGDLMTSMTGANQATQTPNVEEGANLQQAGQAYTNANNAYNQQAAFAQALTAQNGAGNQGQVFAQQQALNNQLQGVANGTGPNPAMAQLNQTTAQNIGNQAALMAGQRGVGQNAGLLARQQAMNGANIQQQAVGQGATLQSQQQLNALGAIGSNLNNSGTLATNQVAGTNTALGNAGTMADQQQANILGAINNQNNSRVTAAQNVSSDNLAVSGEKMQAIQGVLGGTGVAGQQAATAMKKAEGGLITQPQVTPAAGGAAPPSGGDSGGGGPDISGIAEMALMAANGGDIMKVDGGPGALRNTNTRKHVHFHEYLSAPKSYQGGGQVKAANSKEHAVAKGNNYSNDKVPALLSEGEIVLPRSVTQSKDPVKAATAFVQAIMAKQNGMKGKSK